MSRKHILRMLQIRKIAANLEKLAQQLRLPGVVEPQLDLPGVPLELPPQIEKDRYDLSSVDLNSIRRSFHSDIKKIINHELKANPTASKGQILDLIVGRAKEDL